jgi:hypothetical protein
VVASLKLFPVVGVSFPTYFRSWVVRGNRPDSPLKNTVIQEVLHEITPPPASFCYNFSSCHSVRSVFFLSSPLSVLHPPSTHAPLDPGFCNTNLRMVHVTVDMSDPRNQNPVPELEDNEFIETFTVPLKNLWDECRRLEAEGYAIDARVGTLAEGIECARKWKLF